MSKEKNNEVLMNSVYLETFRKRKNRLLATEIKAKENNVLPEEKKTSTSVYLDTFRKRKNKQLATELRMGNQGGASEKSGANKASSVKKKTTQKKVRKATVKRNINGFSRATLQNQTEEFFYGNNLDDHSNLLVDALKPEVSSQPKKSAEVREFKEDVLSTSYSVKDLKVVVAGAEAAKSVKQTTVSAKEAEKAEVSTDGAVVAAVDANTTPVVESTPDKAAEAESASNASEGTSEPQSETESKTETEPSKFISPAMI